MKMENAIGNPISNLINAVRGIKLWQTQERNPVTSETGTKLLVSFSACSALIYPFVVMEGRARPTEENRTWSNAWMAVAARQC